MAIPDNIFTIYGRKPVLEALKDNNIEFFRVHLAQSNKSTGIISDIETQAHKRSVEIAYHDRMALSRISKNKKQDQGVAADIVAQNFQNFSEYLNFQEAQNSSILALDNVTNPQNLGMIIRSVCAGYIDALLLPRKGCAKLDSLVVKASAGTLFKTKILRCDNLPNALEEAKDQGINIYGLALEKSRSITETKILTPNILVLGNETEGISTEVSDRCNQLIHIPMQHDTESLNVSVVAGILSFRSIFS